MAVHEHHKVTKQSEFYLVPEGGYEIGSLERGVYRGFGATARNVFFQGPATAIALGGRWGAFNLGLRWQGTFGNDNFANAIWNKVYGEIGGNIRASRFISNIYVDLGYASLAAAQNLYLNGIGGKVGATADVYPASWFSLGVSASFDLQGFAPPTGNNLAWVNSVGGTFMGRMGFHI
jgi:hypothetical protein